MASTAISNPTSNTNRSTSASSRKKRNKKIQTSRNQRSQNSHIDITTTAQWKSETQQQAYSSKLLHALRHDTTTSSSPRGRDVRETADKILAVTAKGKTRWSRAILKNRLKVKFMKKSNNNKRQRVTVTGNSRLPKRSRLSVFKLRTKSLPAVQRKVRVLGRLVPGCRKESLPVILEEATDYISALEMQVRAMSALAQLLSGSTITGPINHLGPTTL